jgi:glycine oxidase
MKIVVVGAGAAGLAIGWRLAQAGASVDIVERGIAGRGASWAAAGMLAPQAELVEAGERHDPALSRFAQAARDLWPGFASELEEAGGRIGFREAGSLIVAHDEKRAEELRRRADAPGSLCPWLDPQALRAREPLISPTAQGALFAPHDAQVDNRALSRALVGALVRHSVRLRENCEAMALLTEGGRVKGVTLRDGMVAADAVVLANGAWMNVMQGVAPDVLPAVRPAKGQMVALQPPHGVTLPHALLWDENIYLVPRGDRMFAGATVEDLGFDRTVTGEAGASLRAAAARLVPAAREWRLAEIWAGFRPRTSDDSPVLGATAMDGLYVAGGQFRNGILFAPAMAAALCALVLGKPAPAGLAQSLRAFDPKRAMARAP